MLGIYLSGTGNTKHCVEKVVGLLDSKAPILPIESKEILEQIRREKEIVIGYPTQFSNAPKMIRDFIIQNKDIWANKNVFCINTMGAFSGDGAGCTARLFTKYGASVIGALQIKMPDSVCDSKLLKKTEEKNREIVKAADRKIESWCEKMKKGVYPSEGLHRIDHMKGLLGQRLWFYGKTRTYSDKLKINDDCVKCGMCVKMCPMENLSMTDGKPVAKGKCTMCYRCISHCPQKAITLLGEKVIEQTRYERFS